MEKAVDIELLQGLWNMYMRQKDQEDGVGLEIAADIDRMRGVFKLAARGVLTDDEIDHRFSDKGKPHETGVCPKCRNTGMHYDRKAVFTFRASEGRTRAKTATGMVLCECFEGQRRRQTIKEGPKKKKRGSRG